MRSNQFISCRTLSIIAALTLWAIVLAARAAERTDSSPASRPVKPAVEEIRRVVGELAHPIPTKRQAARRQLVRWGTCVEAELRRAADGRNLEASLAAKDLLAELDSAFFNGGQVRLEVDRTAVEWDEPFALTMVVHNPTTAPIRVTWTTPSQVTASRPDGGDAEQVAAMMDVADFLMVKDPQGQEVDFRTDPLENDPVVRAVVERRARGTSPSQLVEPGQTVRLRIGDFNRGWARFPMLVAGKYRIAVWYQPLWKNEQWVTEGLGLVESPPVDVEIKSSAPEAIRDANRPMGLTLTQQGDEVVAELQNLWDRPQWVMLDLGGDPEIQARLDWSIEKQGLQAGEPLTILPRSVPIARSERISRVAPAGKIELMRVRLDALREAARARGIKDADRSRRFGVVARYRFMVTAPQLRAFLAARKRQAEVPANLFTGLPVSNEIIISLDDKTP